MIRVLLTGVSGVGKSTLVAGLAARGQRAIDLDTAEWCEWRAVAPGSEPPAWGTPVEPERDWVWREDRVDALLERADGAALIVAGCAVNQRRFRHRFDHVVLLTAPRAVIVRRLATRTGNAYGRDPAEAARVLALLETVEPLLRRAADHVLDTDRPLAEVVAQVLALVRAR